MSDQPLPKTRLSRRSILVGASALALPVGVGMPVLAADEKVVRFGISMADVPLTTGQPAASVCCGFGADGMPLAFQLAGRPFDEASVLAAGSAYERATPWRSRRPTL